MRKADVSSKNKGSTKGNKSKLFAILFLRVGLAVFTPISSSADNLMVHLFALKKDGTLTPIDNDGLPFGVQGIAAK
jgi:hypothetical protein